MFIDRVHGLTMLIPVDDNPNIFQKVKIIDCVHYELNETVYSCNEVKVPKELERFLIDAFAFNPDYYIPGKMYVNNLSGVVDKLKSVSTDLLIFENGHKENINDVYDRDRRHFANLIDQLDLWFQLGDNRINDAISHKRVISKEKLTSIFNADDYTINSVPKFYFHDIENSTVYVPTNIAGNRKDISIEYCRHLGDKKYIINVDDIGKKFQLNELIMTKTGLKMEKQNIDRLYSDNQLSLNFDVIGENIMVVCRTHNCDKYFTSIGDMFNAEELRGYYYGTKNEKRECASVDFNDISEFYIIDTQIDYDVADIAKIASKSY
jgi:hypothetical protein